MWWKKRPPTSTPWRCSHCGETHENLPTDFGWKLPDDVWAMGEEVRQACLEWSTDVCFHEGRWFLRGVLELPFTYTEGRWGWGCWAEVSEETVGTLWRLKDADGSHLPPEPGILACEIPVYTGSKGLPVAVQFGPFEMRPLIRLVDDVNHA
ncbi:MAG TPA: DUF2199 domain-containing protein, partial [Fimbriimonas sp.]|nr:DUF2199 domain-containing protein [Fimbriimonas sp.]